MTQGINWRTLTLGLTLGLGLYGAWQLTAVAVFHGKALLAPHLIATAWSKTLDDGGFVRPWPWADTWPVAYVQWERGGSAYPVLAGATGSSLAFAPGHLNGSARPGENGLMVISAHRDTHFSHLEHVTAGDRFSVQSADGAWHLYRVTETSVVNADDRIAIDQSAARIVFVTCWPFEAVLAGGPKRYAVFAEQDEPEKMQTVVSSTMSPAISFEISSEDPLDRSQ